MMERLLGMPLIVILMGIGAILMFVPAVYAFFSGDMPTALAFAASGGMSLLLVTLLVLATVSFNPRIPGRSHLLALVGVFLAVPLMLAVPVRLAVPDTHMVNAYVEMVSSITTTGASIFEDPTRLPNAVHLWRALVAWTGGLLVLVTAIAILAPMNLGGFDVLSAKHSDPRGSAASDESWSVDAGRRLIRYSVQLLPLYAGLTALLWLLLYLQSADALTSAIHAMSILSTSGITPIEGGLAASGVGIGGEVLTVVFLLVALSRQTLAPEGGGRSLRRLGSDPEMRFGLLMVFVVPTLLFLRHWTAAIEVHDVMDPLSSLRALWGAFFTVISFLTTTGFESVSWQDAQNWSGLETPGIVLVGLSLIGGGVATTAGGVKLLRVYALYVHGQRELERLVLPSSVGGAGTYARRLRRQGAYLAWIFFMLFAISLTVAVLILSATGLRLDEALTLAVAALSTTGPLASVALDQPIYYSALDDGTKLALALFMVVGRLETLVFVALFNPEFWRS